LGSNPPDSYPKPDEIATEIWNCNLIDTSVRGGLGYLYGYKNDHGLDDNSTNSTGGAVSGSAASGSTVSGSAQDLAQQILNNSKINLGCRHCKEDIQNTAQGNPAYASVNLDIGILKFLLDLASHGSVVVTSITGAGSGHSTGSNHYSGHAIDLECTGVGTQIGLLDQTAAKYKGKNNGELCDRPNLLGNPLHDHYDFFN
jgi:hypothetical protein